MRPRGSIAALLAIAITLALALAGCGGNASPRTISTPAPTPTAPTTPTTPTTPSTPTTPPSSGGGTSTNGTVQYAVVLHATNGSATSSGSVAVFANGDVTVSLTGAAAGASYNVNFCLFPATIYLDNCMTGLTTVVANSSGAGQSTFHFPKSGNWAGIFRVMNGTAIFAETSGTTSTFTSSDMQLEPASATNPQGTGNFGGSPQDSAVGNTVAPGNGFVHVALAKAAPNASYNVTASYMGGSSSYSLGNITTNANGDGAGDLQITGAGIAIFEVQRNGATGLVSGFHVP